jgi:hypothetical protein
MGKHLLAKSAKPPVKLLTLDFILENSRQQYLEVEADKVEYFTARKQIPPEVLPARTLAGSNRSTTRRYFIERFPIFLGEAETPFFVNFILLSPLTGCYGPSCLG